MENLKYVSKETKDAVNQIMESPGVSFFHKADNQRWLREGLP
jgi:hypothetical protein